MAKLPSIKARGRDIAITSDKEDQGVIGNLVFFTFGSMLVPNKSITAWWEKQDILPDDYKPLATVPLDAYMLTCSAENVQLWEKLDDKDAKEYEKLYGEEVRTEYVSLPTKDGTNTYILVRRVWVPLESKKGRKKAQVEEKAEEGTKQVQITPEHPILARLKFNLAEDRIDVTPGKGYEGLEIVEDIRKLANEEYQIQKVSVNRAHHVQALRRLIESEGGVPFGYGSGCMFVPKTGQEALETFAKYVQEVAARHTTSTHGTNIRLVPALDNEKMRQDIQDDITREVQDAYDKLLDTTLAFCRKAEAENVTEAQMKRIDEAIDRRLEDAERLNGLKKRYESLLERSIEVKRTLEDVETTELSGRAKAAIRQMSKMFEA